MYPEVIVHMNVQSKATMFLRLSQHVNGRQVMVGFDTGKTLKALGSIQTDLDPDSVLYRRVQALKDRIIYGKYPPPTAKQGSK